MVRLDYGIDNKKKICRLDGAGGDEHHLPPEQYQETQHMKWDDAASYGVVDFVWNRGWNGSGSE